MHFPVHRLGCHQWHPRVLVGGNLRLWHHHKTESRMPKKSRVKKKGKRRQAARRHGLWMREDDIGWLWAVWFMIDSMQGVERVQVSNEFNRLKDACSTTNLFNILKAARSYSSALLQSCLLGMRCIPCWSVVFQVSSNLQIQLQFTATRCNVICCI